MRLSIGEFFYLLREKLRLTGRTAACGEVYLKIKKRKGKEPLELLAMRWPEKEEGGTDAYGEPIDPVDTEITVPLKKFEFFATRLFYDVEFEMDLSVTEEE